MFMFYLLGTLFLGLGGLALLDNGDKCRKIYGVDLKEVNDMIRYRETLEDEYRNSDIETCEEVAFGFVLDEEDREEWRERLAKQGRTYEDFIVDMATTNSMDI